jgi:hypothetical protein
LKLSIPVSASDGLGSPGFAEGHPFTLKLWRSSEDKDYTLEPEILKGASTFIKHESTLLSLAKYATTGLDNIILPGEIDLKIYPNPTDGKVYISAGNISLKGSSVQVLNALGQVILNKIIDTDSGEINISGNVKGLYYIKITGDFWHRTEKIILT